MHNEELHNLYASPNITRHGCEDNIRMDLRETGWESVDWMHLAQDRDQWQILVNAVMNIWIA
jgi:hypothetical protein